MIQKVISGGQTGVDRAALDAALHAGLPIGGWCPSGRRAEDGALAPVYPLLETPTRSYAQRTAWNVRDSDATLILHVGTVAGGGLSGGTALTARVAESMDRPHVLIDLHASDALSAARAFIAPVAILNVAGPRASSSPGIYDDAYELLLSLFRVRVNRQMR